MRTIDVRDWTARELEPNVTELFALLKGAELVEEVQLERGWDNIFFTYPSPNTYASAGLLSDGRILLVNVEGQEFMGTFASHHDTWTRTYLLTKE
jgi:hypothetical protein